MTSLRLPKVMGHRGAAGLAPENTLASIRKVAECGLDWVEFDVMLAGDGVPILYHDDTLDRTTGRDGLVAETPSEEHLPLRVVSGPRPPRGEILELFPRHVCPTVNLAEEALLLDGGELVGRVPVSARAHDLWAERS